MIIKGNGLWKDIEVDTKESAIDIILGLLNTHQIGWDTVYVNDLLKGFEIDKDDFVMYDLSLYHGAYTAFYKPFYSEENLEELRKQCENIYAFDLIKNLAREIEEAKNLGMKYEEISEHFNLHDLVLATKTVSDYIRKTRAKEEYQPAENLLNIFKYVDN